MNPDPHWITYLAALLTPIVAVLGSVIAYWQWRLARNKLKLDLFDRRLRVYEAALTLLASIMTSGKARDEEVRNFLVATREAKWLLNDSIAEYLEKQLYHNAINLQTLDAELEGVSAGAERSKTIYAQADIKKWLMQQYEVLDETFAPFLQLSH